MAKTDPPRERVSKFALALPDVEEGTTFGYPAYKVAGKAFAWFPKKKEVEDETLAVRMSIAERERRIHAQPAAFYVTPHYEDYTAGLARAWELTDAQLRELLASGHEFVKSATTTSSRTKPRKTPTGRRPPRAG